jgi:hypothetical protein
MSQPAPPQRAGYEDGNEHVAGHGPGFVDARVARLCKSNVTDGSKAQIERAL